MHIKLKNGTTENYSISQLCQDNPNTSFPAQIPDSTLAEWDMYPVTPTERPQFNPMSQHLVEGTPELVEGIWTQTWQITAMSAEEVAQTLGQQVEQVRQQRQQAYQNEADPLFFKAQRSEATLDEWQSKIAEIKVRYPNPN